MQSERPAQIIRNVAQEFSEIFPEVIVKALTLVIIVLITVVRGADRLFTPQFWAEDGAVFFQEAYHYPFFNSVLRGYNGYYHLIPRVIAEFATLFRLELAPTVFVLASFACVVFTCAFFLSDAFSWFIPNVVYRATYCILLAAIPANDEIFLRFVNMQWYLSIICFLLLLMQIPEGLLGRIYYIIGWFILAFTVPYSIIFTPWLVLRAVLERLNRRTLLCAGAATLITTFVVIYQRLAGTYVHSPAAEGSVSLSFINLFVMRVLVTTIAGYVFIQARMTGSKFTYVYLWYIPYFILNIVFIVKCIQKKAYAKIITWLYIIYSTTVPILLTLFGRTEIINGSQNINILLYGQRYFILPIAALYLLIVWWVATLELPRWTYVIKLAVLVSVIAALVPDFYPPTSSDRQWRAQAQRIERGEIEDQVDPLIIPINPLGWSMTIFPKALLTRINDLQIQSQSARGNFEQADVEQSETPGQVLRYQEAFAAGWAIPSHGSSAKEVIVVDWSEHEVLARTTVNIARQDVAQSAGDSSLLFSGWRATFPVSQMKSGQHRLQAFLLDSNTMHVFPIPGEHIIHIPE